MSLSNVSTLVVFCKRPKLGQGKQRLARDIGLQSALSVAEHLLACALDDARSWQASTNGFVVISPASINDVEWGKSLLPNASVVPQPDGNLGQRLNKIDQYLYSTGHAKRIFIGTDSPCLQLEELFLVNQQLARTDVVLKPATDGGVTVMATGQPWPQLSDLPWSTSDLQQALCAQCLCDNKTVHIQPWGDDVDRWSDLLTAHARLLADKRATRWALANCIAELNA